MFSVYFLNDMLFTTEVPNNMSISGSPMFKFRDKILRIESKHGIKSRDVCMTTLGAPYQAVERAKILDCRYIGSHHGSNLIQLPSQFDFGYKVVILQGFFPEAIENHLKAFPKNSKKIINWIGSDVWQLRNRFNWEHIKNIRDNVLSHI